MLVVGGAIAAWPFVSGVSGVTVGGVDLASIPTILILRVLLKEESFTNHTATTAKKKKKVKHDCTRGNESYLIICILLRHCFSRLIVTSPLTYVRMGELISPKVNGNLLPWPVH